MSPPIPVLRSLHALVSNPIRFVAVAALGFILIALPSKAHDIPADVKVVSFLKPSANRLELLVRVPMQAMQDVEIPTKGPGYLLVSKAEEAIRAAAKMWIIDNVSITENGTALSAPRIAAARIALPSDTSFTDFDKARANVLSPRLSDDLDLAWNQQLLDVLLEYPIRSDKSDFAIAMNFDRLALRVQTSLRYLPPDGAVRGYEFHGNAGSIHLDPRWHQSAWRFLVSGLQHILEGTDHLLFLLCLVIPFRRFKPLVAIVTAFTVAHSITLLASAAGFVPDGLWFPPLIEVLIAITILYMALENIVGSNIERRWLLAFAFGLIHGFGFSFALSESLQFAGAHLLTALLAFNIGVEFGQLFALAILVPALTFFFHYVDERIGGIILSALVAHTAWHWMLDRGGELAKFPLPKLDAAFFAGAMRAAIALLIVGAAVWLASGAIRRWLASSKQSKLRI
jgi:hypothetical protein